MRNHLEEESIHPPMHVSSTHQPQQTVSVSLDQIEPDMVEDGGHRPVLLSEHHANHQPHRVTMSVLCLHIQSILPQSFSASIFPSRVPRLPLHCIRTRGLFADLFESALKPPPLLQHFFAFLVKSMPLMVKSKFIVTTILTFSIVSIEIFTRISCQVDKNAANQLFTPARKM